MTENRDKEPGGQHSRLMPIGTHRRGQPGHGLPSPQGARQHRQPRRRGRRSIQAGQRGRMHWRPRSAAPAPVGANATRIPPNTVASRVNASNPSNRSMTSVERRSARRSRFSGQAQAKRVASIPSPAGMKQPARPPINPLARACAKLTRSPRLETSTYQRTNGSKIMSALLTRSAIMSGPKWTETSTRRSRRPVRTSHTSNAAAKAALGQQRGQRPQSLR